MINILQHLDVWTSAVETRSTAGRGSSNKLNLYGIKKLRELILELAVRGQLVPQNPDDEPASVLLEKIATEKARLIKDGKLKKQEPLPPITDDEKPFELPEGWEWVRLIDLALPQAGFAFKSANFNEHGYGLPLIRIRDVGQEFTGTYYDGDYRDEFVVKNGDYLVSMDGQFRVASWLRNDALLNQRVSRLIFYSNRITKSFIADALQARLIELQGVKAYTTVDHLSGGQIAGSIISLPPEAEQHRIVAKVNELMSLCDALEQEQAANIAAHQTLVEELLAALTQNEGNSWARIAAHFDTLFTTEHSIDQLKQTILQLAVMGRLDSPMQNDSDVGSLLEEICKEKEAFKQDVGAALENKKNNRVLLKTRFFCDFITKGTTPSKNELLEQGDIPFLKVYNIVNNTLDFDYKPTFISKFVHNGKLKRSRVFPADIIMNIVGPPLGKVAIISDQYLEWNINQALVAFRPLCGIINKYIFYMLSSSNILSDVLNEVKGTAGQDNLSLEQCRDLLIPIPSIEEQHRIVAKVDELMALCDAMKAQLKTAQTTQLQLADVLAEQAVMV